MAYRTVPSLRFDERKMERPRVPRTEELEFGGPTGISLLTVGMPALGLYLLLTCNTKSASVLEGPGPAPSLQSLWNPIAMALVLGWVALQVGLHLLPIGEPHLGVTLSNNTRLRYKINAFLVFNLSAILAGFAVLGKVPFQYVADHYVEFASASALLSMVLGVFLYIKSLSAPDHALAARGNSGIPLYDFFFGRELNPRIGSFDLKYFFDLQLVNASWGMILLCLLVRDITAHGSSCHALVLVSGFQAFYILDSLWYQEMILTTMGFVHHGFGFALAFRDLCWVPFIHSLQVYYLVRHPYELKTSAAIGIIILNAVGYTIYRESNTMKHAFRLDPTDPHLARYRIQTIQSTSGRRLFLGGWWRVVRHPNYLGDIIMALAWSLPCGFNHLLPYFYFVYLTIFLAYRAAKDEQRCLRKYGQAWQEYCRRVPYKIFPCIY
ncbi:delta(14)-sterol reductase TM7SF2-like [Leptodactylus fuscus]|uniref:delta(14)-sterol reductase TM7SF2-like n=1 Tax=Leptodactylus fuscus TaxID=238119 RepID=UPI003F4E5335